MPSISLTNSSNFAKVLAVVALLFVLGGQQIETVHYHASGDSAASCVYGHNSAGTALLTSSTGMLMPALAVVFFLACTQLVFSTIVETTRVRGPPYNS